MNELHWGVVSRKEVHSALDKMILSSAGWRGIFASCGEEEGTAEEISAAHRIISGAAAFVFAEYLHNSEKKPLILLGCDTRPTGKTIAGLMIPVLLSLGCDVQYAGFIAAPEIMAWARNIGAAEKNKAVGFIFISASHNPIGYNGLKFGLTDGGVLAAEETIKLILNFRSMLESDECIDKITSLVAVADAEQLQKIYINTTAAKAQARKAYYDFCGDVVWGGSSAIAAVSKDGLAGKPLGIVCDFNGSARTVSIDRDFFSALGLKFDCINDKPGEIVHRIVPEGESLEPCRILLEKAHKRDVSFMLGYVPDCDGDRGNLVIWDDTAGKARALEAQEVFALACIAELAHLVWTGELVLDDKGKALSKVAIAVNDPTSMRIDRIAESFGVSVFRAEVGEANVVGLARRLREDGYIVRILGEGSAGGNITHPSAVRDPLNTVLALVKLIAVCSTVDKPGLFEIWCRLSGQTEKYRESFNLADIIASLPQFLSTPAYSDAAVLRIKTKDHALLKDRYQEVFIRQWEKRKAELKAKYGFYSWEVIAYNGLEEKRGISRFGYAGKGGLKICFCDGKGREAAYIWMRGSATEPVFRIMADVQIASVARPAFLPIIRHIKNKDKRLEQDLLNWQRRMIIEADKE